MSVEAEKAFLDQLVQHRLLVPSGVPGVFGRGAAFEDVILRFDDLITRTAQADKAEVLRFPPVISRKHFETSEFLKSFPQLAGSVFAFLNQRARPVVFEPECLAAVDEQYRVAGRAVLTVGAQLKGQRDAFRHDNQFDVPGTGDMVQPLGEPLVMRRAPRPPADELRPAGMHGPAPGAHQGHERVWPHATLPARWLDRTESRTFT